MEKTDDLKLSILVNDSPVYFGAPVLYSQKEDGDGVTLIMQTEIGNQAKQKIEIKIKKPTYVEPIVDPTPGDTTSSSDV